ncbi:TBC1 domain family member 14 [Paragonimus heterotremus]|uniref:TBC1 domain family member 14 n=1 Tax=Paragonimus heterotremus TaxID=100268 RepID=A0A8J4TI10_9TREM|nr:TBC1 domain family member 14 [Paragonimus heterotremus]
MPTKTDVRESRHTGIHASVINTSVASSSKTPDTTGSSDVVRDDGTNLNHLRLRTREDDIAIAGFNKFLHKVARKASYNHPVGRTEVHPNVTIEPASTSYLILQDRPNDLPAKSLEEKKRHTQEYMKLQAKIKHKRVQEYKGLVSATMESRKREQHHQKLLHIWRSEIIPNWEALRCTKRVQRLIWEGIPSVMRRTVWWLLMGNALEIDHELFDQCLELSREKLRLSNQRNMPLRYSVPEPSNLGSTANVHRPDRVSSVCSMCSLVFANLNSTPLQHELCLGYKTGPRDCVDEHGPNSFVDLHSDSLSSKLHSTTLCNAHLPFYQSDRAVSLRAIKLDVSRTFPSLGLFQPGNPYHDPLHDLLAAYVAYRPEIGYVQGMSFLAAILLLVMDDTFDAFVMFANILSRPCHRAFYSLDENEFIVYFRAFDQTLADRLPRLHAHFSRVGLEPNMYLFDWWFTIFSRSLPLEADMRIWDLFFLDGELALFRAALGVLQLYEPQLLNSNFDQLAMFLTSALPCELSADRLVKQMHSIRLKKKTVLKQLARIRSTMFMENPSKGTSQRSSAVHSKAIRSKAVKLVTEAPSTPVSVKGNLPPASFESAVLQKEIVGNGTLNPGPVDHSVVSLLSPSVCSGSSSLADPSDFEPEKQTMPITNRSSRPISEPIETSEFTKFELPPVDDLKSANCRQLPNCSLSHLRHGWSHPSSKHIFTSVTPHSNNRTQSYPSSTQEPFSSESSGKCVGSDYAVNHADDRRLRVCIQKLIERVP